MDTKMTQTLTAMETKMETKMAQSSAAMDTKLSKTGMTLGIGLGGLMISLFLAGVVIVQETISGANMKFEAHDFKIEGQNAKMEGQNSKIEAQNAKIEAQDKLLSSREKGWF